MTASQLVGICGDPGLAHILVIVRRFLNVVYIIGPVIALAGLTYHLVRLVFSPDGKKPKQAVKNWLIAFLMLFLIPIFINVVMALFDNTFQFAACWTSAADVDYGSFNDYFEDASDDGDRNKLDDFSDIDAGTNTNSSSSSNSNSNSNSNSDSNQSNAINTRIWIGDSRTVGMKSAVTENKHNVWSCKTSMGLPWMKSTGIPSIESKISSNSAIIILMGVNDLSNSKSYIKYVNEKAPSWNKKGANVYFVSVNPTEGSYSDLDIKIKNFNSALKRGLSSSVKYIDTYSYLVKNGFSTTDGLHYNNSTYKDIYNYVLKHL